MRLKYRQRIFFYFFIVFILFTVGVFLVEQSREKKYKKEIFESDQRAYAELVHRYIVQNNIRMDNMEELRGILPLLPPNLRVTVIANDGSVTFDNDIQQLDQLENHLNRPEIKMALIKSFGSNIRKSASMNMEFLYYAVHYDHYYVRVASPYDIEVKNFFKSDDVFLYFIIVLFFIVLIALIYISHGFGKSIARLKDFILSAQKNSLELKEITFPEDELGEIGYKIVELYKQIQQNKKQIIMEREKLLQHFHSSAEGICFFTPSRRKIYSNSHFIQYLNLLSEQPTMSVNSIFEDPAFKDLQNFLAHEPVGDSTVFDAKMMKNGKHFHLKAIRFDDRSFEITIDDITKTEKTRLMKQEMTNNIAHELRTPVTSIRGFLETLKEQPDIDVERRQFFIDRSYSQILRLSELIQDISMLTRIEEASDLFEIENVRIEPLLEELRRDLSGKLEEHRISFEFNVDRSVQVNGNRMLLYSIFRNLADNSIIYGGDNIHIQIDSYMEDEEFYYFSYYDTGVGIEEKHLLRIFERFYRVNEGRTRNTGGSGLGLSIVKNAILFHKGEVVAKIRKEGGLEFLFTLKK